MAAATGGRAGARDLLKRFALGRTKLAWIGVALLAPVALVALAALISLLLGGDGWQLDRLGRWEELPSWGPLSTWLLLVLVIGCAEELGWRGWMQERLQAGRPASTAAAIVGIAWVAWHALSFFFDPAFRSWSLSYRAAWAALLIVGSILYAWLYNSSGRSVLVVALFHGTSDWMLASEGARDPLRMSLGPC